MPAAPLSTADIPSLHQGRLHWLRSRSSPFLSCLVGQLLMPPPYKNRGASLLNVGRVGATAPAGLASLWVGSAESRIELAIGYEKYEYLCVVQATPLDFFFYSGCCIAATIGGLACSNGLRVTRITASWHM